MTNDDDGVGRGPFADLTSVLEEMTRAPSRSPTWAPSLDPTERDEHFGTGGRGGYGGGEYDRRFDGDDTASYYVRIFAEYRP